MAGNEQVFDLYDNRDSEYKIKRPPTVHLARGYDRHLPFLSAGRPLVCISDWQYETETQKHFWEQARCILRDELGDDAVARAVVVVAGDMASAGNELRGPASDAVPDLTWLHDSVPLGDVFMVYGNHDFMSGDHLARINPSSGLPCVLPQGATLEVPLRFDDISSRAAKPADAPPLRANASPSAPSRDRRDVAKRPTPDFITANMTKEERAAQHAKLKFKKKTKATKLERQNKQWCKQNPEQAHLVECLEALHSNLKIDACATAERDPPSALTIGAVHGIPASHNQGMKKIAREEYFDALRTACSSPKLDILVTHSNPRLPGQEDIVHGEDPGRVYDCFLQSPAGLLVHGHHHADPVIAELPNGKIVANADCRVVAFAPRGTGQSVMNKTG